LRDRAGATIRTMQGRARFGWRANRLFAQNPPAPRRLTAGSVQVRGRTRPCRTACRSKPPAGEAPAPFEFPAPNKADGLLEGFCPEPRPEAQLAVNSNGRLLLLRLADVDWLEAADNRVALHVGKETHLLDDTLAAVITKLPADRFLRISPSVLVNFGQIKHLRPMCQGEWRVLLRNGTRLTLTRGYGEHLRQAGWFLAAAIKPLIRFRLPAGRPATN
jgi:hypothetical protein